MDKKPEENSSLAVPQTNSVTSTVSTHLGNLASSASNYIYTSVETRYLPWQTTTEFKSRKNTLHIQFSWHLVYGAVVEVINLNRLSSHHQDAFDKWKQPLQGQSYTTLAQKFAVNGELNAENHIKLEKAVCSDWRKSSGHTEVAAATTTTSSSNYTDQAMVALTTIASTSMWIGRGIVTGAQYAAEYKNFPWQSRSDFQARQAKARLTFGWSPLHGIYVAALSIKDENAELNEKSKQQLKDWYPEFHPGNKFELVTGDLHRRHIKAKELIKIELQNKYTNMSLSALQQELGVTGSLTEEQHKNLEEKILRNWQKLMSAPENIYIGPSYANTALGRLLKTFIPKVIAGEANFEAFKINLKSFGLADDVDIEVDSWDFLLTLCFNSCYDFVYPEGDEYLTKSAADNADFNFQLRAKRKSSATAIPVTTLRQYAQETLQERSQRNAGEAKQLQPRIEAYKKEEERSKTAKPSDQLPTTLTSRSFFWQQAPQTSKKEFMDQQLTAAREDFKRIFKIK